MKKTLATLFLLTCLGSSSAYADNALILQTDFSLKDGAVSTMKGSLSALTIILKYLI